MKTVKDKFLKLETTEDFVDMINEQLAVLYPKASPFTYSTIRYYCYPKMNKRRYKTFSIPKKSGDARTIHAPNRTLKTILQCINNILYEAYTPHKNATGFVPNKSIVDNASKHINMNYVYNIDLKDFFPSVDQNRMRKRLSFPPFNLKDEKEDIAKMISMLCCHPQEVERKDENDEWVKVEKFVLPQGAPTSPTLTNIICERLDIRLTGLAKRFGLNYSRYADDITFSSLHSVYKTDSEFLLELDRIISSQNFDIKPSKTRLQRKGSRQEVTGLIVSDKVNVNQKYIKNLRLWLYRWENLGFNDANKLFLEQYKIEKGHIKYENNPMKRVIEGKLNYMKMVKGKDSFTYLSLNKRFKLLTGNIVQSQSENISNIDEVDDILDLINQLNS